MSRQEHINLSGSILKALTVSVDPRSNNDHFMALMEFKNRPSLLFIRMDGFLPVKQVDPDFSLNDHGNLHFPAVEAGKEVEMVYLNEMENPGNNLENIMRIEFSDKSTYTITKAVLMGYSGVRFEKV